MRFPLIIPPLLASLAAPLFAAGEFRLPRRAGLTGTPGYQEGGDVHYGLTDNGWITGLSTIDGATAVWVTNPEDGVSRRLGFFTGEGFAKTRSSELQILTSSGLVSGHSRFDPPAGEWHFVPWVADGATGVTRRAGFTGGDFTSPEGYEYSAISHLTESGFAWGVSGRYTEPGPFPRETVVWVMDARNNLTFPVSIPLEGVRDPSESGFTLTESGWLSGATHGRVDTRLFTAPWVARAATGVTRRMGLYGEAAYFGPFGEQSSYALKLTESGLMAGTSERYHTGGSGYAAWAGEAATGISRRVGLFEGEDYTDAASGRQHSGFGFLTETGWVSGGTEIYKNGAAAPGYAAWVADARTGVTRRVGLFQGEEYLSAGVGRSSLFRLTESGWAGGGSTRYGADGGYHGSAAWVAEASTGVTRRMGFTGGVFRTPEGFESSELLGITESGWVTGSSSAFQEGSDAAGAFGRGGNFWVAAAAGGEPRRMGLSGPEFMDPVGGFGGRVDAVSEEGRVYGVSNRFRNAKPAGVSAWVGDAATGAVTPVGLTGGEFTRSEDGWRNTLITGWTRSGFVNGVSTSYSAAGQKEISWVADVRTGETRRIGDGGIFVTEDGLITGYMNGANTPLGVAQTGFVLDWTTGRRVDFPFGRHEATGHTSSYIEGVTPGGIVLGVYRRVWEEAETGFRPFLWTAGLGTLLSDESVPDSGIPGGYDHLTKIRVNSAGFAVGTGKPKGHEGTAVYFGNALDIVFPDAGLRVTDLARTPEGKIRLSFHTDAAVRITLQSSADLTTWTDAQPVDAPPGASHMDIEPDPAAAPNRYWRLKTGSGSP